MSELPVRTRCYQHHHMDSTRWDYFERRSDDIVIATPYKSGTTWMQGIVAHLIFADGHLPGPVGEISPWLDHRVRPLEVLLNRLKAQTHRRFIKTHLPLDGFEYDPQSRFIVVARDARDAFVSLWNHYSQHTEAVFERINAIPGRVGDEFPRPPPDVHAFWATWIARGWFDWEHDGYPYWSFLRHVESWWRYRHLPNILLVHFQDLVADLGGEIARIARFLDIAVSARRVEEVAASVSFDAMKRRGERYAPGAGAGWKDGASTFFHKGVSGRWREVLDDAELEQYRAAAARTLSPECRAWLERPAV